MSFLQIQKHDMNDDEDILLLTRRLHLQRHERAVPPRWRPAADVYRHRGGWLVKLELAGVAPDHIQVTTRGRWLIVRGHRRDLVLAEGYSCWAMEIAYTQFERVLELPADLDHADLRTRYRDGMLLVSITTERESR